MFLTLADAFALFLGAITFLLVAFGAAVLREPVSRRVVAGGAIAVGGVACITRPSWLFGRAGGGAPRRAHTAAQRAIGAVLVALAALFAATFNTLTRKLRDRSAAMLLSYFMCAMLGLSVPAAVAARALGGRELRQLLSFAPPSAALDWAVVACYAATITGGQLAMATGYQTTPTGKAAVLATTEMAFACARAHIPLTLPSSGHVLSRMKLRPSFTRLGTSSTWPRCASRRLRSRPRALRPCSRA